MEFLPYTHQIQCHSIFIFFIQLTYVTHERFLKTDIKKGEKSPASMSWHFELWTRNLSSPGWGGLYVSADIMEILSLASSERGGAWRRAPWRGKYLQTSHQAHISSSYRSLIFSPSLCRWGFRPSASLTWTVAPGTQLPALGVFSPFCSWIIFPEPNVVLSPFHSFHYPITYPIKCIPWHPPFPPSGPTLPLYLPESHAPATGGLLARFCLCAFAQAVLLPGMPSSGSSAYPNLDHPSRASIKLPLSRILQQTLTEWLPGPGSEAATMRMTQPLPSRASQSTGESRKINTSTETWRVDEKGRIEKEYL